MKVSFIIPTYNEAKGIGYVLDSIPKKELKKAGFSYETIIVDKESDDGTVEIAKSKGVRVINEPRPGYGRAYKTGFSKAKGDFIVTFDADGTYPVKKSVILLKTLQKKDIDFISANRFSANCVMKPSHIVGNKVLSLFTDLLFSLKIEDSQSGMWIFRRKILPKMILTDDGMPFSEEIKIEAFKKTKAIEVPITYSTRKGEVKLRGFSDGFKNLFFLFKKRLNLI